MYPDELWDNFKNAISQDFLRFYGDHTKAYNLAYSIICEMLIAEGHNISNFPSTPQLVVKNHIQDRNELHANLVDMGNRQYNMWNSDQKGINDDILKVSNVIEYKSSRWFYIDGPGDSRKTFVYNTSYNLLKSQSKYFCRLASTGIAIT